MISSAALAQEDDKFFEGDTTFREKNKSTKTAIHKLTVSYGFGIPTGMFASTDPLTTESGFAQDAGTLDIAYTLRNSRKHYGFMIGFRKSSFGMDNASYLAGVNNSTGLTVSGYVEDWSVALFQLGAFRRVVLAPQFTAEPKLLIGMMFLGGRETVFDNGGSSMLTLTEEPSSALAFTLGINLRAAITRHVDLFSSIDFYTASPTVNFKVKLPSGQSGIGSYEQPVSAVSIQFGLAYTFVYVRPW